MQELAWEIQGAGVDDVIEKARSGDLAAFEELIRRHERLVLTAALHLTGNREDAQDAAQQVFLRLHRHISRFHQAESFPPWLYRMTVNACRDLNRRKRPTVALEIDPRSGEPGPEEALGVEQQRRIMAEALKSLPEKQRAALVLRDIEGLSAKEAAAVLGSTEATVRSHASAGRCRIKKFVERYLRRRS
ncbi:MAG: RNA polymerase sigma factor [Bryobacteraceae bacterium]